MKKFGLLLTAFGLLFLVGCTQKSPADLQEIQQATGVQEVQQVPADVVVPQAKVSADQDLLAIVSVHNDSKSCWTLISGSVYDLTSWIGKHPGGDKAILASCGKDGSQLFDNKHGMDPKKWEGLLAFKVQL